VAGAVHVELDGGNVGWENLVITLALWKGLDISSISTVDNANTYIGVGDIAGAAQEVSNGVIQALDLRAVRRPAEKSTVEQSGDLDTGISGNRHGLDATAALASRSHLVLVELAVFACVLALGDPIEGFGQHSGGR
jgi:hypothetical protein